MNLGINIRLDWCLWIVDNCVVCWSSIWSGWQLVLDKIRLETILLVLLSSVLQPVRIWFDFYGFRKAFSNTDKERYAEYMYMCKYVELHFYRSMTRKEKPYLQANGWPWAPRLHMNIVPVTCTLGEAALRYLLIPSPGTNQCCHPKLVNKVSHLAHLKNKWGKFPWVDPEFIPQISSVFPQLSA